MTKAILILGARSDISRACARLYATRGQRIILAARNSNTLEPDMQDLRIRGAEDVTAVELDILDNDVDAFIGALPALPDIVICAVGMLGKQEISSANTQAADLIMRSNYNGPALYLGNLANHMVRRGSGCIIGISSVAGDRGRASNYTYGSAKAGFTAFLSGLRARLSRTNVSIITIKPGFVATRMTAGMDLVPVLTATPKDVANVIANAEERRRNVVYVRPVWLFIILVIIHLPEFIFKKMKF